VLPLLPLVVVLHQLILACKLVLKIALLPSQRSGTVAVAVQLFLDHSVMIFMMEGAY
jgi:hypothetical protein